MDSGAKAATEPGKRISREELLLRCSEIKNAQDFARFMATLMAALIGGEIDAATGNAICKAAANILKAIEMQIKYGHGKPLQLTDGEIPSMMPSRKNPEPVKNGHPRISPSTNGRNHWCHDCYLAGKTYIKATQEQDGDPLCDFCYRSRLEEYA